MLTSITFTAIAAALALTFGNAAPVRREVRNGDFEDQYIVKLKDNADPINHISSLPFAFSVADAESPITHSWPDGVFKGYGGVFVGAELEAIKASPDVEYVQQNQMFTISEQQTTAPWNLQAISTQVTVGSTNVSAMNYTYTYSQPIGDGVDIYILDTGVYAEHSEFEGRATFGYAAGNYKKVDGNGHGTHCAGVAAGKTYGVAKNAHIIGVKVVADNGRSNTLDMLEGLNWVLRNVKATGKPSIASMSLSDDVDQALDDGVAGLIAKGVLVTVSAGNEHTSASNKSPARVEAAITVGASDIRNKMAWYSNYGPLVDVFAPGTDVTSAWIGGPNAVDTISGTSMATPHVAGLAACLLSKDTSMTPDTLATKIKSLATRNAITGAPSDTTTALVYNGAADDSSPFPVPPN